jgi:hypothetical protein
MGCEAGNASKSSANAFGGDHCPAANAGVTAIVIDTIALDRHLRTDTTHPAPVAVFCSGADNLIQIVCMFLYCRRRAPFSMSAS